jgi:CheY-like chemotaxis protein
MEARLILADRMASVGTLAAGVAHEVNNPLAFTIANLQDTQRELASLAEQLPAEIADRLSTLMQAVKDAEDGAQRVRLIVRDLQTFSKSEDDRRDRIDVRTPLEAAIKLARAEISARARLVKTYEDVPSIEANAGRLGQVFLNLLINAAQAIPEGAPENNEIRVRTRLGERNRVIVEVRDSGAGIRAEDLGRIFEPFFTTKRGGTGLGLAICQGIVADLGGEMGAESKPGDGATFRIVLPSEPADRLPVRSKSSMTEEAGPEHVVPPAPSEIASSSKIRVLIIDDEDKIGVALKRALENDHEVMSLTKASEALECLVRGERFDVILCDVMMPQMGGIELYDRLSSTAPGIIDRMVFFTGVTFTPKVRAFLDRVPNRRLEKPIDIDRLRAVIREVIAATAR